MSLINRGGIVECLLIYLIHLSACTYERKKEVNMRQKKSIN